MIFGLLAFMENLKLWKPCLRAMRANSRALSTMPSGESPNRFMIRSLKRAVVGPDAHGAAEVQAELHQGRELLLDARQLGGVLLVGVFLDGKLLRVRVIARVDADHLNPLGGFESCIRLEMNIGNDWHVAAARAQLGDDVLQVRRVLHRRRCYAHDLAAHGHEFQGLLYALGRIHGVAGNHGLHHHGMIAADNHSPRAGSPTITSRDRRRRKEKGDSQ